MRIDVIGTDDSTTPQTRAYAEYRVFAALARHARAIRSVRVVLAHAERNATARGVTCSLALILEPSGCARARGRAPHALGAIDRAAERISELMARTSAAAIQSER